MDNDQSKPTSNFKRKKDRTPILIGAVVLLLAVIGFFYFSHEKLKEEKELQAKELGSTILQLDSISDQLDERIKIIEDLGGQVDTLQQLKEQLQNEKAQLLTNQENQSKIIKTLRGKVEGYTELLLSKDEEIAKLQRINEELVEENTELKTEKIELSKSIQEINEAKNKLAEKVELAGRLKIEGMKVFAVNASGREREKEFRNRHIEQLKITFTVTENKVAPIEGKELLIRITAPDGNALFDVDRGSGTFIFEGREQFYTASQEILYDRNNQIVTLFYRKGSDYAEGNYSVEVFTDDYKLGNGTFIVK